MTLASARTTTRNSGLGLSLVLTALLFNIVLCFVGTRGNIAISNTIVIVCELMILAAGLYLIRERISQRAVRISGALIMLLIGMKFINPGLDLKIIHDLAIMYIFYELGLLATLQDGNRLLWIAMVIVLGVSAFEVLFPDRFGAVFDVWTYYVDKGVIPVDTVNYSNTTQFISGTRSGEEARSFFPSLLGIQRFSSVFLEPVSMGNFSVISFGWCLSTKIGRPWIRWALIVLAAVCAVLADSRFAFACWAIMLLVRMTSLYRFRLVVFCLPVAAMLALLITGTLHEMPGVRPAINVDNFPGRLLFSGQLLDYWGFPQWLGLAPSPVYTSDTGYAYVCNNLGLPLALFMWAIFAAHRADTVEAMSMKAMVAVYAATSLCIGANMFTIKTAALCWFLYGSASAVSVGWDKLGRSRQVFSEKAEVPDGFLPAQFR